MIRLINWKNLTAGPILPLFLSFLLGVISFLDTTFRLVFFYVLDVSYTLSIYLKPIFFICQALFLAYFIKSVRFAPLGQKIDKTARWLLTFHLILVIVSIVLFLESLLGVGLPGQYIDLAWMVLFWVGPCLTAFLTFARMVKRRIIWVAVVFFVSGIAFLVKPLESLYFWLQTYFGLALPYGVVALGTFGPLILMTSALAICALYFCLHLKASKGYFSALRNPIFPLASAAILLPAFLEGVKDSLPNMIVRTLGYWGLGYVGFGWYAVSLYFFSFICYIFIIRRLSSKTENSLAINLIKFGALSLAWNGVTIFLFGYSSILGNVLSIDAIMIGIIMRMGERPPINSSINRNIYFANTSTS